MRATPSGSHQFQRPKSFIALGTSSARTIVTSIRIADGEPEAELLQADDRAGDEAHEGGEHDQPGRRHEPARLREPGGDGLLVVAAARPTPRACALTRNTS